MLYFYPMETSFILLCCKHHEIREWMLYCTDQIIPYRLRHSFPQPLGKLQAISSQLRISLARRAASSKNMPCLEGRTSLKNDPNFSAPHGIGWILCCLCIKVQILSYFNLSSLSLSQVFLRAHWNNPPICRFRFLGNLTYNIWCQES